MSSHSRFQGSYMSLPNIAKSTKAQGCEIMSVTCGLFKEGSESIFGNQKTIHASNSDISINRKYHKSSGTHRMNSESVHASEYNRKPHCCHGTIKAVTPCSTWQSREMSKHQCVFCCCFFYSLNTFPSKTERTKAAISLI